MPDRTQEARSAAISHDERVEGLRNLRTGYGSVQLAVGFWNSLHGEDLIEVYAALAERVKALEDVIHQSPPPIHPSMFGPGFQLDEWIVLYREWFHAADSLTKETKP